MEGGSMFGDGYAFNDERFYPNTYMLVYMYICEQDLYNLKRLPTIPWQTLALIILFSRMLVFPNKKFK